MRAGGRRRTKPGRESGGCVRRPTPPVYGSACPRGSIRGETVATRRLPARGPTPPSRPPVKTTVVLDADTHTRLVAAATLRGVDRSTYAAGILREGLKGVV